jgi:hypothetical protein
MKHLYLQAAEEQLLCHDFILALFQSAKSYKSHFQHFTFESNLFALMLPAQKHQINISKINRIELFY